MKLSFKSSIGIFSLFAVVLAGCQQVEEAFNVRKSNENRVEIKQYLTKNKLVADSTLSGLFYYYQKMNGAAQKPATGDEITIQYIATRLDGVVIDSSTTASPEQFIWVPGSSSASYHFVPVPAFEELMATGLEKIHEGDQITVLVPWSLRSTSVAVSLKAPLYIPLKYTIKILKIRTEEEQIIDYIATNKLIVTEKTAAGLRFLKTITKKDSAQIVTGNIVKTIYTGRFARTGASFDSGSLSVTVIDTAGTTQGGSVVKGFNDGIARLKWGEKGIVIFPSALGYSTSGSGAKIPAYSPLVFEIEAARP